MDIASLKLKVLSPMLLCCILFLSTSVPARSSPKTADGASNQQTAAELKKQITEELKGTTTEVTCTWESSDTPNNAEPKPKLTCGKKILVTGEKIAVINVIGLPTDRVVKVWVNAADVQGDKDHDFSYDYMSADYRPSVVVKVHKSRMAKPTYGGLLGRNSNAATMRALEKDSKKKALSIVLSSSVQEIEIGVEVGTKGGADFQSQSDQIEVVYERWGFETGGFIALSSLVDSELVTKPDPQDASKVQVIKVRKTDKWAQETGIFLSLIPRNYPFLSWSLGLATNSGRNASIYFGPSIRLLGLGDRGLASFSAGIVDRQVKIFPGAQVNQSYAQDSTVLKGAFESRLGGYFLINLGFTFGQIGGDNNNGNSSGK